MRSAILQLPEQRTPTESKRVVRIAIRQLERADMYLGAVAAMDLGDPTARRSIDQLRRDLETLNRYLRAARSQASG